MRLFSFFDRVIFGVSLVRVDFVCSVIRFIILLCRLMDLNRNFHGIQQI